MLAFFRIVLTGCQLLAFFLVTSYVLVKKYDAAIFQMLWVIYLELVLKEDK